LTCSLLTRDLILRSFFCVFPSFSLPRSSHFFLFFKHFLILKMGPIFSKFLPHFLSLNSNHEEILLAPSSKFEFKLYSSGGVLEVSRFVYGSFSKTLGVSSKVNLLWFPTLIRGPVREVLAKNFLIFSKYQSKLQSNPLGLCQNEIQSKSK